MREKDRAERLVTLRAMAEIARSSWIALRAMDVCRRHEGTTIVRKTGVAGSDINGIANPASSRRSHVRHRRQWHSPRLPEKQQLLLANMQPFEMAPYASRVGTYTD